MNEAWHAAIDGSTVGPLTRITRGVRVGASCLLLMGLCSAAQASNFVRVTLGPGASMEVPKNWVILSGHARTTLDSSVEASGFKQSSSSLPFAANLLDERGATIAIVNARFYPDNELTQADANAITPAELKILEAAAIEGNQKAMKATGERVIGARGISKRMVHGTQVIIHEHERTDNKTGSNMRVRGVRVWRSPRSFTVTMNYHEKDAVLLRPIIEYMTNSIRAE